jgi:Rps23 Pro-64 3,4-dihydroxylase Tpa1-like proline 4-hydroxylase
MSEVARITAGFSGLPRAPVLVTDDFLPLDLALAMRQDIEAHFSEPSAHRADTHQVWNYWHVPELYTYLRTTPERVIRRDRVDSFVGALQAWSTDTLGMGNVTWPYLSLYVSGCRQGLHNDAVNGRFAFVYSLTRDQRRTIGGETLVFREGDPFRGKLVEASAGRGFYDVFEPKFNRLIVFDDRLPHAVERVEGSMDPIEGRFVLHGHLTESGTITGALPVQVVEAAVSELLRDFGAQNAAQTAIYQGPLVLRFSISPRGFVETCEIVVDRVVHPDLGHTDWEPLRTNLIEKLTALKFPPAGGRTTVTQPLAFAGPSHFPR